MSAERADWAAGYAGLCGVCGDPVWYRAACYPLSEDEMALAGWVEESGTFEAYHDRCRPEPEDEA